MLILHFLRFCHRQAVQEALSFCRLCCVSPHLSLRGQSWIERRCGSGAMQNLCSVGKIYIVSALLYCRGLCACFSGRAWHKWPKLCWCAVKPYSLTVCLCPSVFLSICVVVLQCLRYALMDFLQTFVTSAYCDKDELIRFWSQ